MSFDFDFAFNDLIDEIETETCPIHCTEFQIDYGCPYCENSEPPMWRTDENEILKICDMETDHILYTIRFLNRKIEKTKNVNSNDFPFKSLEFLRKELKNRTLNSFQKKLLLNII